MKQSYHYTTDRQFVADLIDNNEQAASELLYGRYLPLLRFTATKASGFSSNESTLFVSDLVHEFYLYLRSNNWARLHRYDPSLPFINWLSVVSYRFFKDFPKPINFKPQHNIKSIFFSLTTQPTYNSTCLKWTYTEV